MKAQVFTFLKHYSTETEVIDRLIFSAFVSINGLKVENNSFLKALIIQEDGGTEYSALQEFTLILKNSTDVFGFEELIQLFEFVISPADRVVTGAVYTPRHIREFIVNQSFTLKEDVISSSKIADIACGCGGFLFSAAKRLKEKTEKTYEEIFKKHIFGLDIQSYSITRTKILLSTLALSEGEDLEQFEFNLYVGDALIFLWEERIDNFGGFEMILGNPPYVCSKHISEEVKTNIANWEVSKSGHPDLYIPFFQIGVENLADNGVLGFITMNSFFKSLNGRSLREYFQTRGISLKIIDFGAEQIFRSKNTYTCICFIENRKQEFVSYSKSESKSLSQQKTIFSNINYSKLNAFKGWNLQDNEVISKIEATGTPFGDLYKTRHGIATLRNEIYIFNPIGEDNDYYYLQNGSVFQIEKGICRDIVNSNKLSRPVSIETLKEKVIFPYDNNNKPKALSEDFFKNKYPKAYEYLECKRTVLSQRDKGKGTYERWFAFGRTQSLEKMQNKLFFPKYSDKTPSFLMSFDDNLLFYNGLAIVGQSEEELIVIKKIMESKLFWYYIKSTSKPYSSNYYSLNGNYIKNFGICSLDQEEIKFLIKEQDSNKLNRFFETKYDIKL